MIKIIWEEVNDWRPVKGFEGYYLVSRFGEIYSLYSKRILRPSKTSDGYNQYNLFKNKKRYVYFEHRAVALAFVYNPNPEKYNIVNHIDENKQNNYYKNLEWCDTLYNINYNGNKSSKVIKEKRSKIFYIYDENLNLIKKEKGLKEWCRNNNISAGNACTVLKKNLKRTGNFRKVHGYILSYKEL